MEEAAAVEDTYLNYFQVGSYDISPRYFNLIYSHACQPTRDLDPTMLLAPNDDVAPPPKHDMACFTF